MKELGKKQIFDIFMGILMQVYCMFPWIPAENGKINIFTYLYLSIKSGEPFQLFQSVFLRYDDNIQYLLENDWGEILAVEEAVADTFQITLAVMVILQLLNLIYAFFSAKGYASIVFPAYGRIVILLFLSGFVGTVVQEGLTHFFSVQSEMESRIYYISGMFIYLNFFLLAEAILLVIGYFLKESEESARLLEEERKKAQLHHQKVMENYILNLEQMVDEMRAFQHDYKNIMSTMSGYIRENQMEKLKCFFQEKIQSASGSSETRMRAWQSLRDIGPMELKGFLYEKMMLIMARKICVQVDISENLDVDYEDMEDLIRILGIFIDNAVEETEKSEDGKVGIVIARTKKGVLFRIENSITKKPEIFRLREKGYSTKGEGRGMGLYWAEERINSHEDMFHELKITEGTFIQSLEVMIP